MKNITDVNDYYDESCYLNHFFRLQKRFHEKEKIMTLSHIGLIFATRLSLIDPFHLKQFSISPWDITNES